MTKKPYSISAGELAARGPERIPEAFVPNCHLIYSSPATLFYNSPGAIGFGVKRAGLVIPESVMLLVSPGCCGRNSTILSAEEGYADRMFYLLMDETDLVTGRHLKKIPEAVAEILKTAKPRPKVVLICITCVDALLGTDLERVCREAREKTGVTVVPSYMYALEREGRKPPMAAIRQTVYSLLEPAEGRKDPRMVNLMGFFSALDPESDLIALLKQAGIRRVNQVAEMNTLDEYREMSRANFNLMLHPESRFAAEDLQNRLGMPYIEFPRLFAPEKIHRMYQLLGAAVGVTFRDEVYYEAAKAARDRFKAARKGTRFAVGEVMNGNPYEMAASLTEMGMEVPTIFANLTPDDFPFLGRLARRSPETRIYTGIDPSMVWYRPEEASPVDITVGKDAGGYYPGVPNLEWNSEKEPFGFKGFTDFINGLEEVLA